MRKHLLRTAFIAAGAAALAAGTASAQDYGRHHRGNDYENPQGYASPDENVEIVTPRYHYGMGKLGTPNVRVFLSREVRFDDLDLRTYRGAEALRDRVKLTARLLCRDIDQRWPVTADNGGDQITCYHDAADNALYRAHRVIAEARGYDD